MSGKVEVRLERLVGRKVVGQDGRPIGRLEEVRASVVDGEWVITECQSERQRFSRDCMVAS